jgi:type I site-specific restriction endonuclease
VSTYKFFEQYPNLRIPFGSDTEAGLRRGQIGAIHSIVGHLAIHRTRAITVMPTGSGKTAVLMMLPFFERANRVLVVTPSQFVRNQIAEGFASLDRLIACQVGLRPEPSTESPVHTPARR